MTPEQQKAIAKAAAAAAAEEESNKAGRVEGAVKSLTSGVRQGVEGTVGAIGDAPDIVAETSGKALPNKWTQILVNAMKASLSPPEGFGIPTHYPTSGETRELIDEGVKQLPEDVAATVDDYTKFQPRDRFEKLVHTAGGFAPSLLAPGGGGVVRKLATEVVAPTVGTEMGGFAAKPFGQETLGRLIGGVTGGAVANSGVRATSGRVTDPRRADLAERMLDRNIPLTPGQVTGSKARQYLEAGPFEGKSQTIAREQHDAFNREGLAEAGFQGTDAGPEAMTQMRDSLGTEYDNIVIRNNGVPMDQQLQTDLLDTGVQYERLKGDMAAPVVNDYMDRITDAARTSGGVVPPDVFQQIRSDISRDIKALRETDPITAQSLRDFQDHMFDSIGRNGQGDVVADLQDLNGRYRNFKTIEKSMTGPGEGTSLGDISPAKLRTAVQQSEGTGGYTSGRGDLNELARGGDVFLKDLPQSGTGARLSLNPFSLVANAPGMLYSALTTGPLRNRLAREAINPQPIVSPRTGTLAALNERQRLKNGGGGW